MIGMFYKLDNPDGGCQSVLALNLNGQRYTLKNYDFIFGL